MICYNHFPALDDFCLVVCHVCNQVVTPQGILTHYGKTGLVIIKHFSKVNASVSSPVVTLKKRMFITDSYNNFRISMQGYLNMASLELILHTNKQQPLHALYCSAG